MSATLTSGADATAPATRPAESEHRFSLDLRLQENYVQVVDFDLESAEPLRVDEPPPLGWGTAPNPARLLGAAVGSCLGASLLYCLRKSKVDVQDLRTSVEGTMIRNERGRLRLGSLKVQLSPAIGTADQARLERCRELFEDYCVVTQSVREGFTVEVAVAPR